MVDKLAVKDPTQRWLEIGLHETAEPSVVALEQLQSPLCTFKMLTGTEMSTDKENFWTLLVEIYSAFSKLKSIKWRFLSSDMIGILNIFAPRMLPKSLHFFCFFILHPAKHFIFTQ